MNKSHHTNVNQEEINKFSALAEKWWDPAGEMKPLHLLNPIRLKYVTTYVSLNKKRVLDIGCGGGLLSEAMAQQSAHVTGIDMSAAVIKVAEDHAKQSQLEINYQCTSAEAFAQQQPKSFDIITCMELLEHVPNPSSILQACAKLIKPNGAIFFSTINRNVKSYLLAIVGAEYILHLLPKGTHHYSQFIRPSELTHWADQANLTLQGLTGIQYHPLQGQFELCKDIDVNYLAFFKG